MDPNLLRHIEYFSVPNNQTVNLSGSPPPQQAQQSSIWDAAALSADAGATESPSTAPTTLSLDSYAQQSTAPTSLSLNNSQRQPSLYNQPSRNILPTRGARSRDGHERKRTRLSTTDATPFDSPDYWLQFDTEEGLFENTSPDGLDKTKGKGAQTQSSINTTQPGGSGSIPNSAIKTDDLIDDSALDNALSDDEEDFSSLNLADQMSKIESIPPSEVPPREGLYSTPLSWEKPQPGLRMDSLIGLQSPSLNEAEQRRLIAIAMNPGPTMGGLGTGHFGSSGFGGGLGSTLGSGLNLGTTNMGQVTDSAPMPRPQPPSDPSRSSLSDKGKDKLKPGDRTAHNDIERKYRTNLKDRIAELRDAVPALRTIPEGIVDDGDAGQPSRGPKVSKGTVLTKATEYIQYLEKKNKAIIQQHQELSRRLQAFEQLLNATARPSFQVPNYSRTLFDPRSFC
ncbi:HLH-domain-containing protein [Pleurostoma richardsiae]|uniref:HLH-domain-containing protein n=1 Tax=Pleurostoma richardsiae TaxID=41990 RepID=A0AA38VX76_9PEZI|nr:HLH-domain-containing protein [Pleurostoma richardsiae]